MRRTPLVAAFFFWWWRRRGSNSRPKTRPVGVYEHSLRFDLDLEHSLRPDVSKSLLIYFAVGYEVWPGLAVIGYAGQTPMAGLLRGVRWD
jgi:hypothetical protein